ncbi:two-component sensor histidine kinase [Phenylobacterium hankyongense]|uniref:histidine kinase n=1 Tax=Phenylobacterium hankyongense TaxID=1813876 RepID=A0A328AZX6_9CAUL|nr:ATP-binding protein [Phenylobacterium hankyongense]RAK60177.1 two-component sensor histidine kinase [Phenylobacterium hankyongense]
MRSIGARLAFWYALSATVTLAILFVAGYQLLKGRLINGLDDLNHAEFVQLQSHLGADYKRLNSRQIDERIRNASDSAAVLFYISIRDPRTDVAFRSRNLRRGDIPDIKGLRAYSVSMRDIGELRVDEYLLPPFDVTIATSAKPVRDGMREYAKVCVALLLAMLVASIGIGLGLSRILLRPMRAIRATANRIGSDNLSERIPITAVKDELTDLARLLNEMFDRLESAFNQVRRFSQEASHELKTPLSLIRLHAEKMLQDTELSAAHGEAVLVQIEELARLNQIIDEMLFLSRAEARAIPFDLKPRDPARFLNAFGQDATALAEHTGRLFTASHKGRGQVAFEEKWLRQVLLNVLTNALNASPSGGRVHLRSELEAELWRVSLEDEGPGLPPDQRQRIFERFTRFNTPATGDRGSGLGLTISKSIVDLHGGRIFAEPAGGLCGLRVTFEIPRGAGKRYVA